MKLSEHRKNGQFSGWKKYIHGRNFHLGMDRGRADKIARALLSRAQTLEATGGAWTDAIVEECYAVAEPAPAPTIEATPVLPIQSAPAPVSAPTTGKSLHEVLDLYEAHERLRWAQKQIANGSYEWARLHVKKIKRDIPNHPMHTIDITRVREIIAHYAQRPLIYPAKGSPRTMSAEYATNCIRFLRRVWDWADVEGHWVAPRRWDVAFRGMSVKKLKTPVEKKKTAKAHPHFTVLDCRMYWQACMNNRRMRVLMGIGLWAGHTAQELATILLDDFIEENGELYLDRFRNKTGVCGRWWVPPELAKEIRLELSLTTRRLAPGQNPHGLAFLTSEGRPLVHHGPHGDGDRSDSVKERWDVLRTWGKKHGASVLPFKCFRKTLAQVVRDGLGVEYAKLFCAQAQADIQSDHYTRADPQKLESFIRDTVYPQWKEVFEKMDMRKAYEEFKASKKLAA